MGLKFRFVHGSQDVRPCTLVGFPWKERSFRDPFAPRVFRNRRRTPASWSISPVYRAGLCGALYAVFLQRKALELQQQQMKKEIGEVREQTKLLADQFQQIAPIGRAYDRLEATEAVLNSVYDGGKASISEAIFYLPQGEVKLD
jgi:hypothetical protein